MADLKPCPFCGGSATVDAQFGREWWVECDDCAASTGSMEASREAAIAAWNRRAPSFPSIEREVSGEGGADGVQEPIPERVFWAPLADNFYSADGLGLGTEFYTKWKSRRGEFPQGESFGFGKGSAHNPFKDPPRPACVTPCDGGKNG